MNSNSQEDAKFVIIDKIVFNSTQSYILLSGLNLTDNILVAKKYLWINLAEQV